MRARTTYAIASVLVAVTLAAAPSHAQSTPTDTRWRAWLGCWEPVTPDGVISIGGQSQSLRVCVVPSAGTSAVDIVNVANGKVAERTHVEATAEKRAIGREGCTGVESAAWSPDNRRVYLQAEISCDGVRRTTSGLLAFSGTGEWLDVQGVATGSSNGVHVTRYRPMTDLSAIPVEITQALGNMQLAVSTARAVAATQLTPDDVVDATRHVSRQVVEAWLAERGQGFDLDAKRLVALSNAGVPGSVTDLMIALSYPQVFAINRNARGAGASANAVAEGPVSGRTIPVYAVSSCYSDFGWGPYSRYSSWYNSCGYGYNAYYGRNYNGWYYGNEPIVIINRGNVGNATTPTVTTHPRVVNGQGYTEGRSSSQPSTSSGSSSGSSSSGSSSSGSSSSGSSSTGESSGRTAHPRSP